MTGTSDTLEKQSGTISSFGTWLSQGIASFSTVPLKLVTFIGLTTSLVSYLYAAIIIYKTLMFGQPVKGYPSLMVVILFIGGIQIFSIGILSEYLGRMFDEVKNRPLYIVENMIKSEGKY